MNDHQPTPPTNPKPRDALSTPAASLKFMPLSKFNLGLVVTFVLVSACLSNPSKESYVSYASGQFADRFESLCDRISLPDALSSLAEQAQETCSATLDGTQDLNISGQSPLELVIDQATEQRNFGLFSIYTTEAMEHQIVTIGVFSQFIIIKP